MAKKVLLKKGFSGLATIFLIVLMSFVLTLFAVKTFAFVHWFLSSDDEITFYALGGSTTVGIPYNENPNFIRLISDKIEDKHKGKDVVVVLLASPGKTLFSCIFDYLVHKNLYPVRHSYTFIYSGINENIDNEKIGNYIDIEKIFFGKFIPTVLMNYLYPQQYDVFPNGPTLFANRLEVLLETASSYSDKVFISSLAGNFYDYDPDAKFTLNCENLREAFKCETFDAPIARGNCFARSALASTKYAKFHALKGKYLKDPSRENLSQLDYSWDYFPSLRPSKFKNKTIKKLAAQFDNVFYIPFYETLDSLTNGYIGDNYFIDAHHPYLEGYVILSDLFLKRMGYKLNINIEDAVERYQIDNQRLTDIFKYNIDWYLYSMALQNYYSFPQVRKTLIVIEENKDLFSKDFIERTETLAYLLLPNLDLTKSELLKRLKSYRKEGIKSLIPETKPFPEIYRERFEFHLERALNCELIDKEIYGAYKGLLQ